MGKRSETGRVNKDDLPRVARGASQSRTCALKSESKSRYESRVFGILVLCSTSGRQPLWGPWFYEYNLQFTVSRFGMRSIHNRSGSKSGIE